MIYLGCAGFVVSPLLTSFGNSYELQIASGSIPGFYPLDGLKFLGRQLLVLLPLFIGMRFLSTDYGRRMLFLALPFSVLLYSPMMLFEIRMSPQIHRLAYGYFPHESFAQQIRDGGFRPVVFLSHGLELALITSLALISTFVLIKQKARVAQAPAPVLAAYFTALLYLCKSLGPILFAIVLTPVILFTRPRIWVKLSCAILIFIAFYPALRGANLIPLEKVDAISAMVSSERSESFQMRVKNENALLARANEQPFLGWGAWGRGRLHDEWTGKDISVTDGGWIILFGAWGWFGYLSTFLLFVFSAFNALRTIGRETKDNSMILGGLTLVLAMFVLNMLPNSTNLMLPLIVAGSIASSTRVKARTNTPSTADASVLPSLAHRRL